MSGSLAQLVWPRVGIGLDSNPGDTQHTLAGQLVVSHPVEPHVYGPGAVLLDSLVDDAACCQDIGHNWCWQLQVTHFFKGQVQLFTFADDIVFLSTSHTECTGPFGGGSGVA
eukprot:7162778-Ditylum_brightwellii.AAC.1